MNKLSHEPIISIVVITYNSSRFILETLNSIKQQDYWNIELIISDDFSSDDTINVCSKWLSEHKNKFIRTKLITTTHNSGIPANCNRGIKNSNGEWIKIIAGDDIFLDNAIDKFVCAIQEKDYKIVQTNSIAYYNSFEPKNYLYNWKMKNDLGFFNLTSSDQFQMLKYHYFLNTPAIFIKSKIFKKQKFFEEFPKLEDYPFFIWCTSQELKINYIDIDTVGYRVHDNSVQKVNSKPYVSSQSLNKKRRIFQKFYPNKIFDYPIIYIKIHTLLDIYGFNNSSVFSKIIYHLLQKMNFIILRWQIFIRKKI